MKAEDINDGNSDWGIDFCRNGAVVPAAGDFFDESVRQEEEDSHNDYYSAGSGCGMQKRQ